LRSERHGHVRTQVLELKLEPDKLYLEEIFTDRAHRDHPRLTPSRRTENRRIADGPLRRRDPDHDPRRLDPDSVRDRRGFPREAAEKFGSLAKDAIDRTVRELQELRRQASSSIVVPQGPLGAGGKIQLP